MIEGIDVSSWQGNIDWSKVKSTETKFAYIKATEGATYTNPNFHRDWQEAKAHGITRGAYHFLSPTSEVKDQVANFARSVGALAIGDLPPALDIEGDKWHSVSPDDKWHFLSSWLAEAERQFLIAPIVYIGFYFARDAFQTAKRPELRRYHLWVPNYNPVPEPMIPEPWDKWTFWQFTDKSNVDGIPGHVDRNRFDGSLSDLMQLTVRGKS